MKAGDRITIDNAGSRNHQERGRLMDIFDDRMGEPVVWRIELDSGEIVMEQSDRLKDTSST